MGLIWKPLIIRMEFGFLGVYSIVISVACPTYTLVMEPWLSGT